MRFSKAHAYGNDFLYVRERDVAPGVALDALARELCERHTGIGADGLILYEPGARRRVDAAAERGRELVGSLRERRARPRRAAASR